MTAQQEHHDATQAAPDSAAPAKADLLRAKLKLAGHYAMLGLAPLVAVIALVVAVIAMTDNQASLEQLNKATARIDSLNSSLAASRNELDKLKLAAAKESALQKEELAKHDERMLKIIQNITPLQTKLKISPTLEEQLRQAASAVVAASSVPHAASAVASAPVAAPASAENKISPRVQAMKDAIEKYNKK